MYQNIITDVIDISANEPTALSANTRMNEIDRYFEKWKNSAVFVYITPKDPENTSPVAFCSLKPTYGIEKVTIPLNVNTWNPVAISLGEWQEFYELFPDYYVFIGIAG